MIRSSRSRFALAFDALDFQVHYRDAVNDYEVLDNVDNETLAGSVAGRDGEPECFLGDIACRPSKSAPDLASAAESVVSRYFEDAARLKVKTARSVVRQVRNELEVMEGDFSRVAGT